MGKMQISLGQFRVNQCLCDNGFSFLPVAAVYRVHLGPRAKIHNGLIVGKKEKQEEKLLWPQIHMLRQICGVTRKDGTQNESTVEDLWVVTTEGKKGTLFKMVYVCAQKTAKTLMKNWSFAEFNEPGQWIAL